MIDLARSFEEMTGANLSQEVRDRINSDPDAQVKLQNFFNSELKNEKLTNSRRKAYQEANLRSGPNPGSSQS